MAGYSMHALLVAAGSGQRLGRAQTKASVQLAGKPLAYWAMRALGACQSISSGTLVVHEDDMVHAPSWIDQTPQGASFWNAVQGGAQRADSVRLGLQQSPVGSVVLIHDAARALVGLADLEALVRVAHNGAATILAAPITDTLKRVREVESSYVISETIERSDLWAAQTPQAFLRDELLSVFNSLGLNSSQLGDEAALYEQQGREVKIVHAKQQNPKLTYAAEIPFFEHSLGLTMYD